MKLKVPAEGLAIVFLCFIALPGFLLPSQYQTRPGAEDFSARFAVSSSVVTDRPFDYVLIIMMENKNFSQINDSASAPYLNQLARNYSLATRYTACDHPSLPNYMCLTGGNNYFTGTDCAPTSCTTSNPSIADRIENVGLSWRAYFEDMPSPCYKGALGNYTYATNPFIYYASIGGNSTRCRAHDVPANSGGKGLPDDNLVKDLGSTSTASNYMFLSPNICDNMHSCSILRGDDYLKQLIPLILDSYIFRVEKAALLITFDEGYGIYPTDYVYTVWAGSTVKTHYESSIKYSPYSVLSTIESAWGLQALTAKDGEGPSMMEFFPNNLGPAAPLHAGFEFSPSNPGLDQTVNFWSSVTGGTRPYVYEWSFGDGERSTGQTTNHIYLLVGNYTASIAVTDAFGQMANVSKEISIDIQPVPLGTCLRCPRTDFPRETGLMIFFAIGLALPLAVYTIVSWRGRRFV